MGLPDSSSGKKGWMQHCWECGSQGICRRLERNPGERQPCEYADITLPSIFILQQQQQHLGKMVEGVGFQGEYSSDDLWEWLNETAEGFGREGWSNGDVGDDLRHVHRDGTRGE